jgi:hypothetical protein
MLRPRLRIPLWTAAAIVAAVYAVRAIVRGGDFRPDLPTDAILIVVFAALVLMRVLAARWAAREDEGEPGA